MLEDFSPSHHARGRNDTFYFPPSHLQNFMPSPMVYFFCMHGGRHHEPSVFTHFLPGMLTGFVVGGIIGTVVITHVASRSMEFFWQAVHKDTTSEAVESCVDASGLQVVSRITDTGSVVTSVSIGDGEEFLLTLPPELVHFVPSSEISEAYLTSVSSSLQKDAFPATSLYRVDYCKKTLTHILGDHKESVEILSMSHAGNWVLYMKNAALMLMQTDDARTFAFSQPSLSRPEEVLFSPFQDAVALRFSDGARVVWNMGLYGEDLFESVGIPSDILPAWGMRTALEYYTNIN